MKVDISFEPTTPHQRNQWAIAAFARAINKLNEDHEVIAVRKDMIPKGAVLVEAYETEKEIVICGDKLDENHNCDQMGCTTLSHVIYRFRK